MREVAVEKRGYISDTSARSGATNGPMITIANDIVSNGCYNEWVRGVLTEIIYHPYNPCFCQFCHQETLWMLTISKKKCLDEPLPVVVTSQLRRHNWRSSRVSLPLKRTLNKEGEARTCAVRFPYSEKENG